MQSSTTMILALFACIAIGYTVGFPSVKPNNVDPKSKNFLQQLLINQIVNVLPVNIREKIDSTALQFGMIRHEFLVRCLKELQAFQTYSKIDFITAIQKVIKFFDEEMTSEHEEQLKDIEDEGIQLATLLFENKLRPGELNPFYDVIVKMVRRQIDGQGVVNAVPQLVRGLLVLHV